MKKIFSFIVILVYAIIGNSQTISKECLCNSAAFIDIEYKDSILLYDKPGGKVIQYLKHNFENEAYIHFKILKKKGKMLYVKASTIDSVYPNGWININSHIGVYSRAYNRGLKLYSLPNEKSKVQSTIKEYDNDMYTVIDCCGDWLKVKRILHGKTYIGWMPPEMQCADLYTTCS